MTKIFASFSKLWLELIIPRLYISNLSTLFRCSEVTFRNFLSKYSSVADTPFLFPLFDDLSVAAVGGLQLLIRMDKL